MILTTKARYAVMAVIEIAEENSNTNNNSIRSNKISKPLSLKIIAKNQKISFSYLEQIFAHLKKAGIVKSVKGRGGGYELGKRHDQITIASIVKAIGEPIKMTRCKSESKGCIQSKVKCKTHHLWQGLEDKIYEYLDSISLDKL